MGAGLVRVDAKTRQLYGFSNYVHKYGYGSDAHMTFRISADGSKVAMFDYNVTPTMYVLSEECMVVAGVYSDVFASNLRNQWCPDDGGRLYNAVYQHYPNHYAARGAVARGFNADGDTLYFDNYEYENEENLMTPTVYRTPLYSGEFMAEESIEYIALGDSFTSGEGDIEKKADGSTYYLAGTENIGECHVSSRSYPFLLREQENIDATRMQSVACSGAQVLPDYIGNSESYRGQGDRIRDLTDSELLNARRAALEDFMPGIVTQVEFVKKHQPKTITLMGGGNDVGFGSILEYCASPSWAELFVDGTCGYAIEGHPLRQMLGQSIQSQYEYTLLLLRMIKEASPATAVYVIGYPSFISEKPVADCLNSAVLDNDERIMINDGVTTMNAMLQTAANSIGVKYIDIQNVLDGGRLCEGSEYVTGLHDIRYDMKNYGAEIFHPNHLGHAKMASRILSQGFQVQASLDESPLTEALVFDALAPFGATNGRTSLQRLMTNTMAVEQTDIDIWLPVGSLAPQSIASLTMYSNAVGLGSVETSSTGDLTASIKLPSSLKPGRHVLVLDGLSPSGEPLYYYQFVTVQSRLVNDKDGDGVLDADDPCMFITSWIDERTTEDVCQIKTTTDNDKEESAPPQNPSSGRTGDEQDGSSSKNVSREITVANKPINVGGNNQVQSSAVRPQAQYRVAQLNESGQDDTSAGPVDLGTADNGQIKGVRASTVSTMSTYEIIVIAGIVVLSTLVGGYGILNAIRSRL